MNPLIRRCETCRSKFRARPYQIKTGNGRFCSSRCRALGQPRKPLEERFWARVDKSGGLDSCWPWLGSRNKDGYGNIASGERKTELVHRVAYRLQVGPLASNEKALHTCDNPPCCNGAHLFKGSQADNVADMITKGRHVARYGEEAGRTFLSERQVKSIRTERASGVPVKMLARRYRVHKNSIYDILSGATWKRLRS